MLVLAIVGSVTYMAWQNLSSNNETPQEPVKVTIGEGMTATQIGELLQDEKVIKNALVFKLMVKKQGVESDFKPGEYELNTGMDYDEVIETLIAGPPIKIAKITLPEGWTAKQMASRISALTGINKDDYLTVVEQGLTSADYPFLTESNSPTNSLEGYLYPQTYNVPEDMTAQEFVDMQLAEFQKANGSLNWDNAKTLGRTTYEVMVIASLIERETMVDNEKPIIASVINNRLKKNMLLQIDATIQYALPQQKERLTYDDLEIDSPYNTYKHAGLPPGPICNPSHSSIEAALNPAPTEYLYYVLAPDNSGRHVFTKTYNEFLNAKNQYLRSR